jgi:hypothetical protein
VPEAQPNGGEVCYGPQAVVLPAPEVPSRSAQHERIVGMLDEWRTMGLGIRTQIRLYGPPRGVSMADFDAYVDAIVLDLPDAIEKARPARAVGTGTPSRKPRVPRSPVPILPPLDGVSLADALRAAMATPPPDDEPKRVRRVPERRRKRKAKKRAP